MHDVRRDQAQAGDRLIVTLRLTCLLGSTALPHYAVAAQVCEGCDLYERATQTVFGEERVRTPLLMLVGEQPGDVEDRTGHPFVGPAGELLNEALDAVGIDRRTIYVTNAVKHFKWESRGKLRLHKNPSAREVAGCRPWLLAEIAAVRPKMLLCLATRLAPSWGHRSKSRSTGRSAKGARRAANRRDRAPASIVRIRDAKERRAAFDHFLDDLRSAVAHTGGLRNTDGG